MDLLNVDNESDQKMTWYKVKEMNYRGLLANDRKKKWSSFLRSEPGFKSPAKETLSLSLSAFTLTFAFASTAL